VLLFAVECLPRKHNKQPLSLSLHISIYTYTVSLWERKMHVVIIMVSGSIAATRLCGCGPAAMLLATCKQIDTDSSYLPFSGKAVAPATCT
jgi:hypothetical protein